MPKKPSSKGLDLRLSLLAKAADNAGMKAVAERARRLAVKAIAQGKAGSVTEGETTVIVEK